MVKVPATDLRGGRAAGRSAARLLLDRRFGPYFAGKALSLIGLWAHNLVCALIAWQITHSLIVVSLVSLAQFGPQLLFVGWSGAAADRADRISQVIIGRGVSCLASVALGVWCLGGVERPGTVAFLLGSSFLMGVGLVVGGPAMMALVPSLVPTSEMAAAVRLDSLPMLIGRTLGPLVGALLLAGAGAAPTLMIAAATNALFLAVLALLKASTRTVRYAVPNVGREETSMRTALSMLRRRPHLALLLLGVTATSFGTDSSVTLAPAIAQADGGGEATVGLYSAAFGAGAVLAVVGMGSLARWTGLPRLISGGLGLLAAANLVLALPFGRGASAPAFAVAGAGMSVALTGCTTLLQLAVPDEVRGRVMSLWLMAFVGSRPLAALVDGACADLVSVDCTLVLLGLVVALAAWACRPSRLGVESNRLD